MQIKIKVPNLTVKQKTYAIIAVSNVTSGAIGWACAKGYYKTKFEEIANAEIAEAQRHRVLLQKTGEFADPETAAAALAREKADQRTGERDFKKPPKVSYNQISTSEAIKQEPFGHEPTVVEAPVATEAELEVEEEKVEVKAEKVTINIFDQSSNKDGWDWELEVAGRSDEKPYIIHADEFFADDKEHEHETLTYYEGDDVLCNERDEIVDDADGLVGNTNLMKFGHGSKDRNVVYIRNERTETDFEILLSKGHHSVEVLGADPSSVLEHTERRGVLKMRRDM